jgi:Xaa-Pro dipeptidase
MNPESELQSPFLARQSKLASKIRQSNLDAMVINPGPSLVYLTGLHFHLSERPVIAIFSADEIPTFVIPELEAAKTNNLLFPAKIFLYGEDPDQWSNVFRQAAIAANIDARKVGAEPRSFRLLEMGFLLSASPEIELLAAEEIVMNLRMYKDETELECMRAAARIAQVALKAALPLVKIGISEKELASELTLQLLRGGSAPEIPFSPIVSSGPNSANPHATPSQRTLQAGDFLVIDWGANYQGYFSDITRTFAIGKIEQEFQQIYEIVQMANAAGRAAAKPWINAQDIDRAARSVIEQAGYGEYFIHRTGHGLGMEGHEAPYIRDGNTLLLEPGMTFTVEPGIYISSRNGVRIEDDVVITHDGAESLTDLPRDLIQIA